MTQDTSAVGAMFKLVAQTCLQQVDCLTHVLAPDLCVDHVAVDVDGDLCDDRPGSGRVRRFRQLHAGREDRFGDTGEQIPDSPVSVRRRPAWPSPPRVVSGDDRIGLRV